MKHLPTVESRRHTQSKLWTRRKRWPELTPPPPRPFDLEERCKGRPAEVVAASHHFKQALLVERTALGHGTISNETTVHCCRYHSSHRAGFSTRMTFRRRRRRVKLVSAITTFPLISGATLQMKPIKVSAEAILECRCPTSMSLLGTS